MSTTHVCILAAGHSKRMRSKLTKVLHPICGRPMILHVLGALDQLNPASCSLVVGYQRDAVIGALETKKVDFVVQEQQLGTGHAVQEYLRSFLDISGTLLVLNGDTPLLTPELLQNLIQTHGARGASVSLVTAELENPKGYGRIIRSAGDHIEAIIEESDADEQERSIREVNAGIYAFDIAQLRQMLPEVTHENKQHEYYLPDVVPLALKKDLRVVAVSGSPAEVIGINTRAELAAAQQILRRRINEGWMARGVTIHDPHTTYIDVEVQIGADVILYPNVYLEGSTMIGSDVVIYSNCRITNSYIDEGCVLYDSCVVDSSHLAEGVKIGPFARLRPNTHLATGVRIGNFVELKNTTMGEGSKANHLSYLGDATIGRAVNVGAGTITCNYDGEKKHRTTIEDEVFIGSDTQLIAPVTVGKGAYVAAGSSITDDVPPESLAIARGRQVNKEGWTAGRKKKK